MSEADLSIGKKLLQEDFIQANPACVGSLDSPRHRRASDLSYLALAGGSRSCS